MTVSILCGEVRDVLRSLPSDHFDCVITSPPYWGLRSYLHADHPDKHKEIGCERTLGEHIETLVDVFREVRRVIKPRAAVWLNYGDCYATTPNGRSAADTKAAGNDDRTFRDKPFSTIGPIYSPDHESGDRRGGNCKQRTHDNGLEPHRGRIEAGGVLKAKDLCLIPFRLAIMLQNDGWWVRSRCIWGKPNGMPDSSGRYRPSVAHEEIFLFSKSGDLDYDFEAVKSPPAPSSIPRWANTHEGQGSSRANGGSRTDKPMRAVGGPLRADKQRGHSRRHQGFNGRWDLMTKEEQQENGRLLRSYEPEVWHIATAAFSESHFATFPPALVERCIMASCKKGGAILDPFGGAGTVGLVADRMGRDATLIELNPEYVEIAKTRIRTDAPLFVDIEQPVVTRESTHHTAPLFAGRERE
jgi:DNA modification methylase